MALTRREWQRRQHSLNLFIKRVGLVGVQPIREDGIPAHATRRRIKDCQYWLGYAEPKALWTQEFAEHMRHPWGGPPLETARRGRKRRRAHNAAYRRSYRQGEATSGVVTYDGRKVAAWLVPHLQWARARGWRGRVNSGWRDPAYSERLCYQMCGAPRCPGRCAGRSSGHSGSVKPRGAVDVSDYYTFGELMHKCPYNPRIFNALGVRDPVHFSSTGR